MIPAGVDITLYMPENTNTTTSARSFTWRTGTADTPLVRRLYVADSKIELCVGARTRVCYGRLSQKEALFEGVSLNVTLERAVQITARKP